MKTKRRTSLPTKKKVQKKSAAKITSKKSSAAKVASRKASSAALHELKEAQWPNKRNILFRPERYKYIRKIDPPKTCVFCDAVKNDMSLASLCVYKTEHSMIVLNKYPYNNGHLLVLPQRHIGDLLSLTQDEYADLMDLVKKATQAVKDIYSPSAMNLGMNHGAAAGAGIPDHLHFHIIPRWSGDLNFFPLIAETKVVIETLEQTYEHFVSYFSK